MTSLRNKKCKSCSAYRITNILFLRMFDSLKRIDFIYRFTGMYHREIKALKVLHEFTDSVIATRRHELANSIKTESDGNENEFGIKTKTAFLDLLLQSTIDGESLSNEDIREEVDTFMFEVGCVFNANNSLRF